jgi:hypothetical protein
VRHYNRPSIGHILVLPSCRNDSPRKKTNGLDGQTIIEMQESDTWSTSSRGKARVDVKLNGSREEESLSATFRLP